MSLLATTYKLLDASDLTYREIAEGAGVDFNWLVKFKQRSISSPGVHRVQNVHDFLARVAKQQRQRSGAGIRSRSQSLRGAANG